MLKTPRNYPFAEVTDSLITNQSYKIAVNDIITLRIYSNNGSRFFNLSGRTNIEDRTNFINTFKVRSDSTVKIPVIGKQKVVGKTIFEVEEEFQRVMEKEIKGAFVIAEISNKRVFLFRGGNSAQIIGLANENTTLMEVLAGAGGIDPGGNASRVKIVRGNTSDPQIYLVDLSTIEGMKQGNMVLQSEDIIYIDPFINYATLITSDIASITGLVSSLIVIFTFTNSFNNN